MEHEERKLREWLREFGCENACDVLVDTGFDSLTILASLDEEELQMLEVTLKDLPLVKQRRILKKVEGLQGESGAGFESPLKARLPGFLPEPHPECGRLPEPVEPVWPVPHEILTSSSQVDLGLICDEIPFPDKIASKKEGSVVVSVVPKSAPPPTMISIVPVGDDSDDLDDIESRMSDEKVTQSDSDDRSLIKIASSNTVSTAASSRVPSRKSSKSDSGKEMNAGPQHTVVSVKSDICKEMNAGLQHTVVSVNNFVTPGRIDEVHPLHKVALLGGFLCLNSGWVNGVGFRGFDGGVTHITGTATKIGLKLATQEQVYMLRAAAKVFVFIFGGVISGSYLGRRRLFKGGPRQAHLLLLVSALTFAAFGAETMQYNATGSLLLTLSSGMLNAMTSLYSGAVVKTATVTSTATDIGVEIGNILFHKDHSGIWKLKLLSTFMSCWIAGGFFGALCFDPAAISGPDFEGAEAHALLVPATLLLIAGLAWLVALQFAEPDPRGCGLFAEVSVFRREGIARSDSLSSVLKRRNSLYAGGAIAAAAY
jgi:uncharacterized membrane protein YoaK (UPF0700 family)